MMPKKSDFNPWPYKVNCIQQIVYWTNFKFLHAPRFFIWEIKLWQHRGGWGSIQCLYSSHSSEGEQTLGGGGGHTVGNFDLIIE